jgi:ribonuclease-3
MPDLVEAFAAESPAEATVIHGLLDAHGVPSVVASPGAPLAAALPADPGRGIRILVRPDDLEHARALIAAHGGDRHAASGIPLGEEFRALEQVIGYTFRDAGLLEQAMTHTSRAHEDVTGGVADNESLEFLGDAVLGLVVADTLFHQYPNYDEGQKSKIKAAVVSTQSLARHAEHLRLGEHLILGRGEEKTGGRFKQALLADGYEALIAALYLDGGLEAAETFLRKELKDAIDEGSAQTFVRDYKSALQERLQALGRPLPEYRVSGEAGPDHRKTFSIEVVVSGEVLGAASGRAKKEAEQEAARLALEQLSAPDSGRFTAE